MVTTLIHLELVREYRMKRRNLDKKRERKGKDLGLENNFFPSKEIESVCVPT